jgi:hypothetical protein
MPIHRGHRSGPPDTTHEETDMTRIAPALAALALALALAACGPLSAAAPVPPDAPSVDATKATEIAEQALDAFNSGDYASWSEHWDAAMKGAIKEADFQAARAELMGTLGSYVSHGTPTLTSKTPETFRWSFPVTFEKATATFALAFRNGTTEVTAVRFE